MGKTTQDWINENGRPLPWFESNDWNVRRHILHHHPLWSDFKHLNRAITLLNDLSNFEIEVIRGEEHWIKVCDQRWQQLLDLFGYEEEPEYWAIVKEVK